jgi:hypothetical protein
MRFAKIYAVAAGLALAACGGPSNDDVDVEPYAPPSETEYATGVGDKPDDSYVDPCAEADGTVRDDVWLHGARDVDAFAASGTAIVDGNLHIGDVDTLEGLACLRQVNGSVIINGTEALKDLDGLERLGSIHGSLWVTENAQLVSMAHLGALKEIAGDLVVERNEALVTLDGVANLSRGMRGGIYVRDNDALVEIDGFARLPAVGGELVIEGNPALDHINAFYDGESHTEVYGDVVLRDNAMLGWAELPAVAVDRTRNTIRVEDNPFLKDLRLHGDTKLRITGDLVLRQNDSLEALHGFDRISAVTGDLVVEGNSELDGLMGLQGIKGVMGDVSIVGNRSIHDVEMWRLEEVHGSLDISRNASLMTLAGLSSLRTVLGDLQVVENPELDTCFEDALVTRFETGRSTMDARCSLR